MLSSKENYIIPEVVKKNKKPCSARVQLRDKQKNNNLFDYCDKLVDEKERNKLEEL